MKIQAIAHLVITANGETQKIRVLVRENQVHRAFKLRLSGADGTQLTDESRYIESRPDLLLRLAAGKVIKL